MRAATLHAIEHGEGEAAAMGAFIADRIVRCHLKTMARLNVDYDLLTWEGDILRLQFWATAFEILEAEGSVFLQADGPLKGCWVMRIDDDVAEGGEGASDGEDVESKEKVIVRSNGTVTYVGKDIANQFWKFGLLGKDFHYRRFATRRDGSPLFASTSDASQGVGGRDGVPVFGAAGAVYNVIDSRQAYLQRLLKQALFTMGHRTEGERSTHFSYEMVALSHATARELGYDASIDADRPFVEVSGRKGLGVKADDLLDRLIDKASGEVSRRNAELGADDVRATAERIAVAALRYFMVKFSRAKVIAFDIDEALSFEGESGPVPAVRGGACQKHLRAAEGARRPGRGVDRRVAGQTARPTNLVEGAEGDDLWGLVLEAARLDEVAEQAVRTLEPSLVAKYTFGLAQAFNAAYHRYPILNEENQDTQRVARRGGGLRPPAADPRARPDGLRSAGADVAPTRVDPGRQPRGPVGRRLQADQPQTVGHRNTHGPAHRRCPEPPPRRLPRVRPSAGGDPVLLDPNVDRGSDVARAVDGILLTGGGDVSPHLYGELPDPTFKAAEPHRDALELELAVRAIELDVPVLAICRGLQVAQRRPRRHARAGHPTAWSRGPSPTA